MTVYSFDTSSFLNGRRDLLPPSTFPTLWNNIEALIDSEAVQSIDLVRDELTARDDDVASWAKAQEGLFVPLTTDVQAAAREVLVQHDRIIGVGNGRSGADPFVIALAMTHNGVVVTEEIPKRNPRSPKIPDVCEAMGIPCLTLLRFIQQEGWVFR